MKVYLVDDYPVVIEGYKALLKAHGIKVVGASSDGVGVVEWLSKNASDVLILDLSIPCFNGLEALKQLSEKNSHIKTIVVTSYYDVAVIQEAMALGAKGYILKEESVPCIVAAIKAVFNGKKYFSESVRDAVIDKQLEIGEQYLITDILSPKEATLMVWLLKGFTPNEISSKMHISSSAFRSYTQRIRQKLNVKDNIQLAVLAAKYKTQLLLSVSKINK
ncbi:Two component transcriptional regulator, LuxR family [Tenacibaculum maritimum]|uniref:response regulator n=1 Tax=Tenacibaculum maritimum TaxID=107401 RepID=UPI0012E4C180|nr:response regulator transcription factor [Tenacibaculum maritimum]CAA0245035.1 Two component transcriptional regulator, LuxR family [Tenacibaculum maritimum]